MLVQRALNAMLEGDVWESWVPGTESGRVADAKTFK